MADENGQHQPSEQIGVKTEPATTFAINTGPATAFATNLGTAVPMNLGMDKYSYPISHEY